MEILSNRDSNANLGGGRAARILVADDNSNIQRMVALALKDHGIDVIAVGNGEAAVRSMAQVTPDLILADVFMPVRSGYEVCEYVKNDSRFSHIPVVLLLGAFDPLDENEAKRVGADGVLKKPFVPPDPMIALVKALLEKSAPERMAPVPVGVSVAAESHAAPEQPVPVFRKTRIAADALPPVEESPEIDYPPMGRDAFDSPSPVVAAIVAPPEMQASATTEVEDAEVMTRHRDSALGEPAFWHPAESEGATEETQNEPHAGGHDFEPVAPKPGYFDSPVDDATVSEPVSEQESNAQPETVAAVESNSQAGSSSQTETQEQAWVEPVAAPEADAQTPEESGPERSASSDDWLISATTPVESELAAAAVNEADNATDWAPAPQEPMVELSSSGEGSFAPSSAVWSDPEPTPEAIVESAAAAPVQDEPHVAEPVIEHAAEQPPPVAESAAWEMPVPAAIAQPQLADTQRITPETLAAATHAQDETFASESSAPARIEAASPTSAPASDESHVARPTTDELVNAVVARVIQKLQPQIADMINEEILRPVVSALVRREIENQ